MGLTPKLIPDERGVGLLETGGVANVQKSQHVVSHELAGTSGLSFALVRPVWEKTNHPPGFAQAHLVALRGANQSSSEKAEDQRCLYDVETLYEAGSHRDPAKLLPSARIYVKHSDQPKGQAAPVTVEVEAACLEGEKGVQIPFPAEIKITTRYIGDADINGVKQQDVSEAIAHFKNQGGQTLEFTSLGVGANEATRNLRTFMLDTFFNSMVPTINEARRAQNGKR